MNKYFTKMTYVHIVLISLDKKSKKNFESRDFHTFIRSLLLSKFIFK